MLKGNKSEECGAVPFIISKCFTVYHIQYILLCCKLASYYIIITIVTLESIRKKTLYIYIFIYILLFLFMYFNCGACGELMGFGVVELSRRNGLIRFLLVFLFKLAIFVCCVAFFFFSSFLFCLLFYSYFFYPPLFIIIIIIIIEQERKVLKLALQTLRLVTAVSVLLSL